MTVKIVTDSTSDIPAALAQELGITVIPLYVYFGSDVFRDGVDMTRDQFFARLTSGNVLPRTSQPSVGDFLDIYLPLCEEGHEIVSIHISDKLSGTLNSARGAVQELGAAKIELVDTKLASLGITLVVRAAAEAAKTSTSAKEVADAARKAAENIDIYFVLDTLEYLQKGGRIGRAQALLGSMLSIKPVLKMQDGEIHPHEKVRTRAKALNRLQEIALSSGQYAELAMIHEGSPEEVASLRTVLTDLTSLPLIDSHVGPVIGTYTGPNVMGFVGRKG
ncbi:MAG: DegV family protein [Dehalococcoidia bacterium]